MKQKNQKSASSKSNALIDQWQLWLLASLTLGLAPFSPEPHLWGKLKWVWGGANGMQLIDYWDLVIHGTPWVLLIISLIRLALQKKS